MMDYFYLVLAGVAVALCLRGPQWGAAAMAATLPLSKRFPSLPIPLLNTQNIIVLAAFAAILMRPRDRERATGLRFALPLGLFSALASLSFANTMLFFVPTRYFMMWDPYAIVITFKNLLTCMLIYALGCLVVRTREDLDLALKGLMLGMAFEGAFVCAEVVVHGPARANGHLLEGNSAGAYLAGSMVAAAALVLLLKARSFLGATSLAAAGSSAIGLIFTQSRGNWIAGVLACGFVTLLRDRRILILIVVALATYQIWLPQSALDRINQSFTTSDNEPWRYRFREGSDEAVAIGGLQNSLLGGAEEGAEEGESEARLDSSSQVRLYVWSAAVRMIGDYPLGVGYGVFPFYVGYYSDVIKFRAAHNTYLQMACEMGIPGLILFLCFLGCLLYECWTAYRTAADPQLKGVALAAMGTGVAMMTSAFFYNFFFQIEVNGQQWFLLGLAMQVRPLSAAASAAAAKAAGAPPPVAADPVPLHRLVR